MKKTALTLATLIGLSATGGALAQALDFNVLDADADGFISIEELQVAIPDLAPETFASFDLDGDGVLSPEEFTALLPAEAPAVDAPLDAPAVDAPFEESVEAPIE